MKNKLYQPMEASQALSFIASNHYDTSGVRQGDRRIPTGLGDVPAVRD